MRENAVRSSGPQQAGRAAALPSRQNEGQPGVADRRSQAAAQRKLTEFVQASPRVAAQAKRKAELLGAPAQRIASPNRDSVHRIPHGPEEDDTLQLKAEAEAKPARGKSQSRVNRTELPDPLKSGVEALSGMSVDHVKVHYNSDRPEQLSALAYAQDSDIHLGPGQEKHLPHEVWHVVQQAQGRVRPTLQMKDGIAVNDDPGLEREADVMGARALSTDVPSAGPDEGMRQAKSPILVSPEFGRAIQRLTGAAAPIVGHDEVLPGDAADRGEAALKIANYINLRARTAGAAAPTASSDLGANNAGHLYVCSNYLVAGQASSLETWSEMTGAGGGYVKRVRIREAGVLIMDRVMHDPAPTALNTALHVHAALGAAGAVGTRRYGSVHGVDAVDAATLGIEGATQNTADNITKIVAEGARFGWLAEGLSTGTIGNATSGIFKVTVRVPQVGRFTMNPTFENLWGAWRSVFGRKYLRDKDTALSVLRERMIAGWTRSGPEADAGAAPLEDGATAGGQVTSLTKSKVVKATPRSVGDSNGAAIVAALKMTFISTD